MKLMRIMSSASTVCGLSLVLSAPVLATDIQLAGTGADSNQTIEVETSSDTSTTNVTVIQVSNENIQTASTGSVAADATTNAGGISSGDAANHSSTTTTVTVDGTPAAGPGQEESSTGEGTASGGSPSESGQSGGAIGVRPVVNGIQGGNVLGVSTGGLGGAILPVTGPSQPVDVSALRVAVVPQSGETASSAAGLVKQAQNVAGLMLLGAALLSLAGAIGSTVYALRKEGRV